ncbi:MAG: hypothetical protein H7Z21_03475 [Hymenobacter sp.]|nr:hypothetical protein [Hymenobacter sp.]
MAISTEVAAQRTPVWLALSELYLDTELLDADYKRIALVLREAGLNWAEAEAINTNEVAPVVIHNLLSVAGEWSGFDEEWLVTSIMRCNKPPKLLGSRRLWWYFVRRMLKSSLVQLQPYTAE